MTDPRLLSTLERIADALERLSFDTGDGAEHEDTRYASRPGYEALVEAHREDLHAMRVRLSRAYDRDLRAMLQVRREKARAEAAEAECDALLTTIERLRATHDH